MTPHFLLFRRRASGGGLDPQTKALLHFDGANGSTTFTDEAGAAWTTTTGTPIISTAQSKFGGASLSLNGSSGIAAADDPKWDIGTDAFTIEAWIYPTAVAGGTFPMIFARQATSGMALQLRLNGGRQLQLVTRGAAEIAAQTNSSSGAVALNTWTHVAASRSGSVIRLFIGGNLEATDTRTPQDLSGSDPVSIGGTFIGGSWGNHFTGYIDEFRLTIGLARYTSSFTPSGPFTS